MISVGAVVHVDPIPFWRLFRFPVFSNISCTRTVKGAFFIRRGNTGEPHSALRRRLEALQEEDHESGAEQVFRTSVEGEARGVTPSSTNVARKLEGETSFVVMAIPSVGGDGLLSVCSTPKSKSLTFASTRALGLASIVPLKGSRIAHSPPICLFSPVGPIGMIASAFDIENNANTQWRSLPPPCCCDKATKVDGQFRTFQRFVFFPPPRGWPKKHHRRVEREHFCPSAPSGLLLLCGRQHITPFLP